MRGTNLSPFVDNRDRQLFADIIEITLDLPMPVSGNRMNRHVRGRAKPYPSREHLAWKDEADVLVMATRQYPKRKIYDHYEMTIYLSVDHVRANSDGDNRFKPIGDWLQSRDIVRNDRDCRKWRGEWVKREQAPSGCRVILRALPDHV